MWPFRRETGAQEVRVTGKDLELLTAHGLPPSSKTYITMFSGLKDKRILGIHTSAVSPGGVTSCPRCEVGAAWFKGDSVRERHSERTEGRMSSRARDARGNYVLTLGCPFDAFMGHLSLAGSIYGGLEILAEIVRERRLALVRVEVNDLQTIQPQDGWGDTCIRISTRKLKVLDVIDALNLVPDKSLLVAITDRYQQSEEWKREWHRLVDAMQPLDWRQFGARFAAAVQRLGLS